MYDAWTMAGVGGGSAALTWLAAGRTTSDGAYTLRLSLDKGNSLLGDVRFLGGTLAWVASMYTKGNTKAAMQTVAAASIFSLAQTEIIRMRLAKAGNVRIPNNLPLAPTANFGALPGPNAQQQYSAPQGSWAHR